MLAAAGAKAMVPGNDMAGGGIACERYPDDHVGPIRGR